MTIDWTAWIIAFLGVIAAGSNITVIVLKPHSPKTILRILLILAVLYFVVVYSLIGIGLFDPVLYAAKIIRPAIGVLLGLIAAYAIVDKDN